MARTDTSEGEMIAALTSAGILYWSSTQNEILDWPGCGSMRSILPTGMPRMRISSPGYNPLLLAKYAVKLIRDCWPVARTRTTVPPTKQMARRAAHASFQRFDIIGLLPTKVVRRSEEPRRARARRREGL